MSSSGQPSRLPGGARAGYMNRDIAILRELARQYAEAAARPVQNQRRQKWRRLNSLERVPPPIYIRACAWHEMPQSRCLCEDPFYRQYEDFFRRMLFQDTFEDDYIIEPWVTVSAAWVMPRDGPWGLPVRWTRPGQRDGAGVWDPPLKEETDIDKLVAPQHAIDEDETARRAARLAEAVGDIVPVAVDRAPAYRMWLADISTELAKLRGIEQLMLDMIDRPAWLHGVLAFMRDGILRVHEQAEQAGDWSLLAHQNQAMPYARELPAPAPDGRSVPRRMLWCFCASQELTAVGPEMFEEFMLEYQLPIVSRFGLCAYGCCEDLTRKIGVLRRIPNLRRVAAAPAANVATVAQQVGDDYVISYRPSPADMVAYGLCEERVRSILARDLAALRGCCFDITLKDVETVEGDPHRIRRWVAMVRRVVDEVIGS